MLTALLFVAAAMALIVVLLLAVVVAGIRQEPADAEMTSRAPRQPLPWPGACSASTSVAPMRQRRRRPSMLLPGRPWLGRGRPMTHPAGWTTAEPCPLCGSSDILECEIRIGANEIQMGWECRECGHLATWTTRARCDGHLIERRICLGHAPARHHHPVRRTRAPGTVRPRDRPARRPGRQGAGEAGTTARGPAARLRPPSARTVRQPSAPRRSPDHRPLRRPASRTSSARLCSTTRSKTTPTTCPPPGGRARSRC